MSLVKEIFDFLNHQDTMYKLYQSEKSDFHGTYIQSFDDLNTDKCKCFFVSL